MKRPTLLGLLTVFALASIGGWICSTPAWADKDQDPRLERLSDRHREWLIEVDLLLTDEQIDFFLELSEDYQRQAFIDRFWRERDPDQRTGRNEFKVRWNDKIDEARANFGNLEEDRARQLLLHGAPAARIEIRCRHAKPRVEAWLFPGGSELTESPMALIFYRRFGVYDFVTWYPNEGTGKIFEACPASTMLIDERDALAAAIDLIRKHQTELAYLELLAQAYERPDPTGVEWLETFAAYLTTVPEGAETLEAELTISYPGRLQSRTAVQGVIDIAAGAAGRATLAGLDELSGEGRLGTYRFLLNGEVLRDGELFESFRYRFDLPATGPVETAAPELPLVFQRPLRPGDYSLVVRVEDLASGAFFREERQIAVPQVDRLLPSPESSFAEDDEAKSLRARMLADANRALTGDGATLRLISPPGKLLTGMVRVDTLLTGSGVDRVVFALDGREIFTKTKAPFGVEFDLGNLPRTHTLTATALDRDGTPLATDELLINSGSNRFEIHLIEPRKGQTYETSLPVRAEVAVPSGETLDRLELYFDETLVATLYDPPFAQPLILPNDREVNYLRAVAYLDDGNSTEVLNFVNAPDYLDEFDVQLVELFATVTDGRGRPVEGLTRESFRIREDGVDQEVVRFERVEDLPIHAGILLDVSASMEDRLVPTVEAAFGFFRHLIEPEDRGALILFNDRPHLAVPFTNRLATLGSSLAGLKAERGTALYDSVIFGLYTFHGIKGQKALLVLSDGKDESSRFSYENALEFAQRAGVTIYAIGLDLPRGEPRRKLGKIAEETGGASFFIKDPVELQAIYAQIEDELRSQYFLAYQSNNTSKDQTFRKIAVTTEQRGQDVKTASGYYP